MYHTEELHRFLLMSLTYITVITVALRVKLNTIRQEALSIDNNALLCIALHYIALLCLIPFRSFFSCSTILSSGNKQLAKYAAMDKKGFPFLKAIVVWEEKELDTALAAKCCCPVYLWYCFIVLSLSFNLSLSLYPLL